MALAAASNVKPHVEIVIHHGENRELLQYGCPKGHLTVCRAVNWERGMTITTWRRLTDILMRNIYELAVAKNGHPCVSSAILSR